jgi:hypothetical protein
MRQWNSSGRGKSLTFASDAVVPVTSMHLEEVMTTTLAEMSSLAEETSSKLI